MRLVQLEKKTWVLLKISSKKLSESCFFQFAFIFSDKKCVLDGVVTVQVLQIKFGKTRTKTESTALERTLREQDQVFSMFLC